MIILRRSASALALLILLGSAQTAFSQFTLNWQVPGTANWNVVSNWDGGFDIPDSDFDESANISNGGTAVVNGTIFPTPGQIILGMNVGETGNLIIENGGSLTSVLPPDSPNRVGAGGIEVGRNGVGFLTVQPGGSLAGRNLVVGGELDATPGSTLTVGGAGGSASNVNIEFATTVSRELRVIGPNVNFVSPALNLFSTSIYTPEITASTHSTLDVSGTLLVDNGTLRPTFSNGVVPSAGDSWDLFDAGAINGQFTVDASAAPALPLGQTYRFTTVPSAGNNGVVGRLSVDQVLVLNVDRASGAMSINTGPVPVSLDGYAIQSGLGGLNPAGWNSLQDQAISNWRESPQGGSANQLSELKPTGATTVTSGSPLSLGSTFQLPTATQLGTELEDLTFEYYSAGGIVTQGIVNYIGNKQHNNVVLLVDPDTGEARLENQSPLTVNIDGYKIESESGSLLPANGQWNSLDDQNAAGGNWRESSPSENLLAELKPTSSTTLPQGLGFDLGELFLTELSGGTEDLTFDFLITGESQFRQGVVDFRSFDSGLTADFNDDSLVNGTDLAIWESAHGVNSNGDTNSDGDSDGSDFLTWQRQFTGTPAIAAVPEPTAVALLLIGALPCGLIARRK